MDIAQTFVRSVVRAFYNSKDLDTRHILIVDALIIHSALRDDDLSYLMSMNLKDLHRICARLKEDRFLHQHVRPELREGQLRPTNRTYYYIDYRQAIDAIKWRVYHIDKEVQGNAVPQQEKKEYFCGRCQAEWTQMEVLDNMQPDGFHCHRCDFILVSDPERQAGGHEQSTRLNNQLKFITEMLPELDRVHIPDNNFEVALSNARPVVRDAQNQVAQSIVVEPDKPTAVQGMANAGPQSIAINITEAGGPSEAEQKEEAARREKLAAQNALPEWHMRSTVSGTAYSTENANGGPSAVKAGSLDDEDKKPSNGAAGAEDGNGDTDMDAVFAKLMQQQQAREAAEEDDDDDEEDEFEDVDGVQNATSVAPSSVEPDKKLAAAAAAGASISGTTSAADTPASTSSAKKVKVAEPAAGGGGDDDEDSDDDDIAFEDV